MTYILIFTIYKHAGILRLINKQFKFQIWLELSCGCPASSGTWYECPTSSSVQQVQVSNKSSLYGCPASSQHVITTGLDEQVFTKSFSSKGKGSEAEFIKKALHKGRALILRYAWAISVMNAKSVGAFDSAQQYH